jgi:hypothetical protein
MAEFKISRFRYTWKGAWAATTNYIKDDVVGYGGKSYVCFRNHTAQNNFYSDLNYIPPGETLVSTTWVVMADGYVWKGAWTINTFYKAGDIVNYGGVLYICTTPYTSGTVFDDDVTVGLVTTNDINNWAVYSSHNSWNQNWTELTRYAIGDVVRYGGIVYRCITGHTSSDITSGLEVDLLKWSIYYIGFDYKGAWDGGGEVFIPNRFKPNDLVQFGGSIWRCIKGHTSAEDSTIYFDGSDNWRLEIPGQRSETLDWNASTLYHIGDVIQHGGYVYYSLTINYNSNPSASIYQIEDKANPEIDWQIVAKGVNFRGDWSPAVIVTDAITTVTVGMTVEVAAGTGEFAKGTVVTEIISATSFAISQPPLTKLLNASVKFKAGTNIFYSLNSNSSTSVYLTGDVVRRGGNAYVALLDTTADGSSLDYFDASNWELITPGTGFKGYWEEYTSYAAGDVVTFYGSAYKCSVEHISDNQNYPGDNGNGINVWDLLIQSGPNVGMNAPGDILTYNLSRSATGDGSSFGATNVPIGNKDQILIVDNNATEYYKVWGNSERLFYVMTNGVDDDTDPNRGLNFFKPFKTVRYACEKADDGYAGSTTIKVFAGKYEEVLPIIVPARTAIHGEELRSVSIAPKAANPALVGDSFYTLDALTRISNVIAPIMLGNPVVKTASNPNIQTFPTVGALGSTLSTQAVADEITNRIADIQHYIDYHINGNGTEPTMFGSNTAAIDDPHKNGATLLNLNKEFLVEEAIAYIQKIYPGYAFSVDSCKRDLRRYIDAIAYDIIYTGNYKSLVAGRLYRNAVKGSITEDMFYLRDATGVRNCTLLGLTGTLTPTNQFRLYQRPTGGAYCSLDAGWGPNDDRTWIKTRSPYIQNVTTFGYAAIGQKVDGSLHNGGNKSFVSNDFTQVISDGIGAWVLNNGRVELVSVFTYYSQVGYLAEDGGIIRATNGNNSYGRYGALATGNDLTEVPKYATVNNRNNQAKIAKAFAGEVNDYILLLEFDNAGQNYTQATYSFIASGVGVDALQDEFRDGGVYSSREIVNPGDSTSIAGGGGFTYVVNNAQSGDTTSITIAQSDANAEYEYLGLRLIITSGPGTGQYGYITAYNTTTKKVSIARETDGLPGWDHIVPGTPIVNPLLPATRYSIEPRAIFSAPDYSATEITLSTTAPWSNIAFGETYEVYSSIPATLGTGTTIGVTPVNATFTVQKIGRKYNVSLVSPGAGYTKGDVLTIPGTQVGGVSPDNDITVTVVKASDDSTDSILTFSYTGNASSGRFVMTATDGNFAYSKDGTAWTGSVLPSVGNWNCISTGANSSLGILPTFVIIKTNSLNAATSSDGVNWADATMPASRAWSGLTFGKDLGLWCAVASDSNSGAISTNGTTWTTTSLPATGPDSTFNQWVDVAYGKKFFVAVANNNNLSAIGVSDGAGGLTWTANIMDAVADSTQQDWVSIAYGNNRFVAISSQGGVAYSFDGLDWYGATMPSQDGSTAMNWKKIRYAQGVFFAVCDTGGRFIGDEPTVGPTIFSATSPDGLNWTTRDLASNYSWAAVGFGNPDITLGDSTLSHSTGMWIAVTSDPSAVVNKIRTGATTKGRVTVSAGIIYAVRIWEPGSGYDFSPTLSLIDPNNSSELFTDNRIADGVLAQPSWINRGLGYRTSNTAVTVNGDGFADIVPVGKFVTISNLASYPKLGAQFFFENNPTLYRVVRITEQGDVLGNGTLTAKFQLSPSLKIKDTLDHGTRVTIRERYSQCRITGHDFLDIGTGNFIDTNYPKVYSSGAAYLTAPEDEVVEQNGGKVFYASTDQSGNFRAGELFAVEQATGVVTISADFFNLNGLQELKLGGVRLGGSGVVIREFSTDTTFSADSNNIISTQRAIKAYLTSKLSVSGADLSTAQFTAGEIKVGPTAITEVLSSKIIIPVRTDFNSAKSGIKGMMMAQALFYRSFKDDGQE